MYKITKTYTDYNDNERTEDFYFNLNSVELAEMAHSVEGGLDVRVEKIVKANNVKEILEVFKDLLLRSYGEKSDDGRRFIKSDELSKAFSEMPVYEQIYWDLATDDVKAAEFINNVIPKEYRDEVQKAGLKVADKVADGGALANA